MSKEDNVIEVTLLKDIYITDLIVINYELDMSKEGNKLADAIQQMYPHNKVIAVPKGITITSGR